MTYVNLIHQSAIFIATILTCASCLIYTLLKGKNDRTQNKLFIVLLVDVMVSAFSCIGNLIGKNMTVNYSVSMVLSDSCVFVYFLTHTALAPVFFYYSIFVSKANHRISRDLSLAFAVPMIITEVFVITNPLTRWVYSIGPNVTFKREWAEVILYVAAALYYAISTTYVVINWKAMEVRKRIALVYFFMIIIAGVLIQLFIGEVKSELFAEALALMGFMLVIENEDHRIDNQIGIYNRSALREDLRAYLKLVKRFDVISIRLTNSASLQRFNGASELITVVTDYLKEIHPWYRIYHANQNSFMLLCMEGDEGTTDALAHKIHDRFKTSFKATDEEVVLHAYVMTAEIPARFKDTEDIMLMVDGPLPPKTNMDVIGGDGLNYLVRWAEVENAVHRGFTENSYEVFYQPVYDAKEQRVHSAEALLRLHDSLLGEVPPSELIPVAEQNGIIEKIGEFVLEEVCHFFSSGIPVDLGLEYIDINLSVIQCMQTGFVENVVKIVSKYKVEPSRINFEITEAVASSDHEVLDRVMKELKGRGFRFSMDEYGIGYSNMQSIFTNYFDIVKIDRNVLWEAEKSVPERVVLENSVRMMREMNRKILVEGVETQDQINLLNDMAVDYLQGYYFSKPVNQNEFIGILRVTEQARMEEKKARAANEAKSNFLASMSHEIRTPINAVLGMDEMILRECKDDKIREFAQNIEGAGKTLLSLINDILDFSKIEAGDMEITEGEYKLSAMLHDVINMIQIKANQKNLEFKVAVDERIPENLIGDEMRIRQVMLNILNNAVKYTQKGSVTLDVRGTMTGSGKLTLRISVSDTGMGIRKEDMNKLFNKFQRLDLEKNKTIEGSGLGLAITYNLLHLMNGDITVDSEYGKGSTFIISIPQTAVSDTAIGDFKKKYSSYEDDKSTYRELFRAPEARILVVDDTPMNHTVMKQLLKKTLIKIDSVESGLECLDMVGKTAYDIIFLDYRMPGMDGVETLHRMREADPELNRDVPVISLTANALSGAREEFLAEGFSDYLMKPIDSKELEMMLIKYLPEEKVEHGDNDTPVVTRPSSRKTDVSFSESTAGERKWDVLAYLTGFVHLDIDDGIRNCGSKEVYLDILGNVKDEFGQRSDEIWQAFMAEDWGTFTDKVHALKSTMLTIGAKDVAGKARTLEEAGDNRDIDYIRANTPNLLEAYRNLVLKLKSSVGN
ncbi:MAG: EAL domain-containing protein [Lachnospiraceae bacterium]|nr:EAL domain-containing protein [Lachnospiraceae bacterium]